MKLGGVYMHALSTPNTFSVINIKFLKAALTAFHISSLQRLKKKKKYFYNNFYIVPVWHHLSSSIFSLCQYNIPYFTD